MEGFVYEWINNLNGKWYIGSHNGKKPHYISGGIAMQAAIEKYGIENFTRHKFYCNDFREQEDAALKRRDAHGDKMSYNLTNEAGGGWSHVSNTGSKRTEESRTRMSEAQQGKVCSPETKAKISLSKKGSTAWNVGLTLPEQSGDKHPGWKVNSDQNVADRLGSTRSTVRRWREDGTLEQKIVARGFEIDNVILKK